MSKLMLSKFKKSLGQSSRIVSDSRVSSSLHHQLQMFETSQRRVSNDKQDKDRSSLNLTFRNSHDNNKLIRKIPMLISQNDQLKEKIQKLEDMVNNLTLADANKRKTFSFQEENQKGSLQTSEKRTIFNERWQQNQPKTSFKYSLDNRKHRNQRTQERYFSPSRNNNYYRLEYESFYILQQKIDDLQKKNNNLQQENMELTQKCKKLTSVKDKNSLQIDHIVSKFKETLVSKDELSFKQAKIFRQKIEKIQQNLKQIENQKEIIKDLLNQSQRQVNFIKNECFQLQNEGIFIHNQRMSEYCRQNKRFTANEGINHLWAIKNIQFKNIQQILQQIILTNLL